jgi:hypothetical protein
VEIYSGSAPVMSRANLRFNPMDDSKGNSIGSQNISQLQPVTVVLSSYSGVGYSFQDAEPYDDISWLEFVNWSYINGGNHFAGGADYSGEWGGTLELLPDGERFAPPSLYVRNSQASPDFMPVWEQSAVSMTNGDILLQRTNRTKVMLAPPADAASGMKTYLVLAHASEFSTPYAPDVTNKWESFTVTNWSEIFFSLVKPALYAGDVPLPPEWLQINGQALINTGVTNADGSVWGYTLVSAPSGVNVDVTPTVTHALTNNDYTFDMKACEIYPAVDVNRDGNITFDAADQTTADKPYRFWANNDRDGYDSSISDYDDLQPVAGMTDDLNTSIPCTRDLEDYARLWINTHGLTTELQNGTLLLALEWTNVAGTPGIRLFPAVETNGGTLYLTDEITAQAQTNAPYGNCIIDSFVGQTEVSGSLPFIIPTSFWVIANVSTDQPVAHLLFDAVGRGSGQLVFSIYKNDGVTKIFEGPPLYLDLKNVKEMYERYTVGESGAPATTASLAPGYSYDSTIPAENNYILFVHGWNLAPWERDAFAETAFKRLYWQGYKGHFGAFQWPTGYGFGSWKTVATDPDNFDNSESNAWAAATGLLGKLNDLNAAYPGHVYLFAHSMGNVVVGEALRLAGSSQVVNTYVAMQGAIAAHCYDAGALVRSISWILDSGTPNCYAHYPTSDAPCYFNGTAGARTFINFYNPNDWALAPNHWQLDQDLKPDSGYGYNTFGQFYRGTFSPVVLDFPANTYEIFAYADEARCYALGAQADVGGAFRVNGVYQQIDLSQPPYSFGDQHRDHSGEFNSDNMNRFQFWNEILNQMKLK